MLDQTFALSDIPRVFTLAFLELLLSADNAVVLGVISHSLPERLRKKALFIGLASSFVLRAAGLLSVSLLLKSYWIQIGGAAYLLYLSIRHFYKKSKSKREPFLPPHVRSFWKVVVMIELFDLAFAVDSIVAGVAFISTTPSETLFHPKLWIVYFGGMLGLIGTRYTAEIFSRLITRFPGLDTSAYLMIGWIGIELGLTPFEKSIPGFQPIFWTGIVLLFLLGFRKKRVIPK